MKARKTMESQALIQEVITQVSQQFAPRIPDIKNVRDIHIICNGLILTEVIGHRCPIGEGVY